MQQEALTEAPSLCVSQVSPKAKQQVAVGLKPRSAGLLLQAPDGVNFVLVNLSARDCPGDLTRWLSSERLATDGVIAVGSKRLERLRSLTAANKPWLALVGRDERDKLRYTRETIAWLEPQVCLIDYPGLLPEHATANRLSKRFVLLPSGVESSAPDPCNPPTELPVEIRELPDRPEAHQIHQYARDPYGLCVVQAHDVETAHRWGRSGGQPPLFVTSDPTVQAHCVARNWPVVAAGAETARACLADLLAKAAPSWPQLPRWAWLLLRRLQALETSFVRLSEAVDLAAEYRPQEGELERIVRIFAEHTLLAYFSELELLVVPPERLRDLLGSALFPLRADQDLTARLSPDEFEVLAASGVWCDGILPALRPLTTDSSVLSPALVVTLVPRPDKKQPYLARDVIVCLLKMSLDPAAADFHTNAAGHLGASIPIFGGWLQVVDRHSMIELRLQTRQPASAVQALMHLLAGCGELRVDRTTTLADCWESRTSDHSQFPRFSRLPCFPGCVGPEQLATIPTANTETGSL